MKKHKFILFGLLLMCLTLFGCGNTTERSGESLDAPSVPVAYDFEPITFYSFDELNVAIADARAKGNTDESYDLADLAFYYVPTNWVGNATLDAITVKDRYVCVYYCLGGIGETVKLSPDEEEILRISNTISLEWIRESNGARLLENTIRQFSLQRFSDGVYYCDVTYPTQPDEVLAKSFYWVTDGFMFHLDLPMSFFEGEQRMELETSSSAQVQKINKEELTRGVQKVTVPKE